MAETKNEKVALVNGIIDEKGEITVELKNPWHYISKEGYPKKEGKYLVATFDGDPSFCVETFYTNMSKASSCLHRKKGFCYHDSEWGTCYDDCVFAWMDIPELPTRKDLV